MTQTIVFLTFSLIVGFLAIINVFLAYQSQKSVGTMGFRGPAGPPGKVGDLGPSGPRGYEGPSGPQGPQGHRGLQGRIGPEGSQGQSGALGPTGPLQTFAPTAITILDNTFYISRDDCESFEVGESISLTNSGEATLICGASNGRTIVVGGNQVSVSSDFGTTWNHLSLSIDAICTVGHTFVAHFDRAPYLRYSSDGVSWNPYTRIGNLTGSESLYAAGNAAVVVVHFSSDCTAYAIDDMTLVPRSFSVEGQIRGIARGQCVVLGNMNDVLAVTTSLENKCTLIAWDSIGSSLASEDILFQYPLTKILWTGQYFLFRIQDQTRFGFLKENGDYGIAYLEEGLPAIQDIVWTGANLVVRCGGSYYYNTDWHTTDDPENPSFTASNFSSPNSLWISQNGLRPRVADAIYQLLLSQYFTGTLI